MNTYKPYSYGVKKTNDGRFMVCYHSCGGVMSLQKIIDSYEDAYNCALAYNFGKAENTFVEI